MRAALPLIAGYAGDAPLIHPAAGGAAISQARFVAAAMALSRTLPADATHVLPLAEDRGAFMLAFAAALLAGKPVLLPPSGVPAVIAALRGEHPQAIVLGDSASQCEAPGDRLLPTLAGADDWPGAVPMLPAGQLAAIAYTSGSTGAPKPEPKSWAALCATAEHAGMRFLRAAHIVGTVPPQHMYGLEATVMMAFAAHCTVSAARPFFPADVAAALAALPEPRLLVTTPVHLRACVAAGLPWPAIGMVLSATAPLTPELACAAEAALHAPLFEIYGCTEAGSLATRRLVRDERWLLYPELRMAPADGSAAAVLHAPYLPGPVRLGDDLELDADGAHFRLLGRDGEMLKVAGKRIALGELTQALLGIEGVADAVVVPASRLASSSSPGGAQGEIERPAALVVAPGLSTGQILQSLALRVDPVFLPRPLRLVRALPRNALGKLPLAALRELLDA